MTTGLRKKRAERYPPLDERTILAWADAYNRRHDRWPTRMSGQIPESGGDTWNAIDLALRKGFRGLPPGLSINGLLYKYRSKIDPSQRPDLTIEWILNMAKAYYFMHGKYPNKSCGQAIARYGLSWGAIDAALRNGSGGLQGGSSLSRLLKEHYGARNKQDLPPYSTEEILVWADAYNERNAVYPMRASGSIREAPGETWSAVNSALVSGRRGFQGGSSLAQLLAEERGVRNVHGLAKLSDDIILRWADAHFEKHGTYPNIKSGPVDDVVDETWYRIHECLRLGLRGLPKGRSLLKLLVATGRRTGKSWGRVRA